MIQIFHQITKILTNFLKRTKIPAYIKKEQKLEPIFQKIIAHTF